MSEKRFERWNDHSCKVKDNQEDTFLNWEDVVNKLNEQQDKISRLEKVNEQLKKAEKINMEYAEQIVEENKKLRIAKNDLRRENEQLHHLKVLANAFIVEKGLEVEFVKWCVEE